MAANPDKISLRRSRNVTRLRSEGKIRDPDDRLATEKPARKENGRWLILPIEKPIAK
jgi:hypothetical protein